MRKRKKRLEENGGKAYKKGKDTIKTRNKKKLLANTNWFKNRSKDDCKLKASMPQDQNANHSEKRKVKNIVRKEIKRKEFDKKDDMKFDKKNTTKAVVFVPFTEGSRLAKLLREAELKLEMLTGFRLKVVERAGTSLADKLHKSNPWSGTDCGRENCLLCETKAKTGKNTSQSCTRRSITYMTWCQTCFEMEVEKLEGTEVEKEEQKNAIKYHLYLGETSRSAFERGFEHKDGIRKLNKANHFLKHLVDKHREEDWEKVDMQMKVVKYHRSAFERQIYEAVLIQEYRHHHILNSKSEYNRAALPRIGIKMGDKEFKQHEKENIESLEKEEALEKEITKIKRAAILERRGHAESQPNKKKLRTEIDNQDVEPACNRAESSTPIIEEEVKNITVKKK